MLTVLSGCRFFYVYEGGWQPLVLSALTPDSSEKPVLFSVKIASLRFLEPKSMQLINF